MAETSEIEALGASAPPPANLLNGASLFLDFDGTLVDIVARPDAVRVDPALIDLIAALTHRLGGRLAIVSGRGAAEVHRLFGGADVVISGSHGAELRRDGVIDAPARPVALDAAMARMQAFASAHPGVLVEAKPLGVGLHYRGGPQAEAAARDLAEQLAQASGLTLQAGKMVFELRAPGDKGSAISALMAMPPFAGSLPVFVGDDLTDEPGFAVAQAMGGAGVLVGPARASAAGWRLDDVAAVRDWLTRFGKEGE